MQAYPQPKQPAQGEAAADAHIEKAAQYAVTSIFAEHVTRGMTVAVGGGSRGLTNRVELMRGAINGLRELGAEPFVVPASPTSAGRAAERRRIDPPGLAPLVPAYSVAIRDGDLVFVSGMTGVKPGTQEIIEGGVGAQTRQTLENIRAALVTAGATMADVGECTVFLTDMADYPAMNAVYIEFFPRDPPSRATLAVTALPRPAARVEIKCSARVPH